jgi:predicted RND superfamily exporter protein
MISQPALLLARLVDVLVRFRFPILVGSALVSIGAIFPASNLKFNQSIESMFGEDDQHLMDYVASRKYFGGDELVGVVYQDPELLAPAGLERVRALSRELSEIQGVQAESTQSLASNLDQLKLLNEQLARLAKIGQLVKIFRVETTPLPPPEELRRKALDLVGGVLIGADEKTTAVVVRLAPDETAPIPRAKTISAIRDVAAKHEKRTGFTTYVAGEPVQIDDMFRYVQEDGSVLGWASTSLLVVVILVLFRRLRWVLLPILVVQATLLWTKAILVFSQIQLTMVSSVLESLVTIMGVATVMHMSLVYCELRRDLDRVAALHRTFVLLATDVFWVCATTAAGFAAELSSHVYPIRSFGVIMTLGSMLVLAAIALILPGGVLLGKFTADPDVSAADKHLGRWLTVLGDWIEKYPWRLLGACGAITVVSMIGMLFIRVETEFIRNFRTSSPIVQAIGFVEDNLGGAGNWEVNFPAPEQLTDEYLDQVRKLVAELRELPNGEAQAAPALTKVTAITDGIDLVPERVLIKDLTLDDRMDVLSRFQPEFAPTLYSPDDRRMRIVLRARERQPAEAKEKLIRRVEEVTQKYFPADALEERARATGLFVLLTFIVESMLGDQWMCFFWGAVGIIGMMTIAYRSLRIGLISLIPNLLPIVLVVGAMGWLGLPINIGTAMISSVSMGLTVDASIFYISSFRRMQKAGMDFSGALRTTQHEIGRALIYSNAALILGFLVLTLSHFIPLVYFGFLVSVAILGGLAGNLVLLPLLMRAFGVQESAPVAAEPAVAVASEEPSCP